MHAAKFPVHRDLAGFDFDSSKVDQPLIKQLATLSFTDSAQNAVLIGGPGTGKTHLATAMALGQPLPRPARQWVAGQHLRHNPVTAFVTQ